MELRPQYNSFFILYNDTMVTCYCNIAGRFFTCSTARCRLCGGWSWKKRYCSVASVFIFGCFLVSSYSFVFSDTSMPDPPCYAGRFEAGEDALMPTVMKWTQEWLNLIAYNESELPHDLRPCTEKSANICQAINCSKSLQWDVSDRIGREMVDFDLVLTMRSIIRIQCFGDRVPISDVIAVTAASSNQFIELQAWLQHVHQYVVPEIKENQNGTGTAEAVVVDMGLRPKQIAVLRKRWPDCKLVTFPYWSFPDHVNEMGNCSARRPIIIRAFLTRARDSLIYSDPDIVINPGHVNQLLRKVNSTGVLFSAPSLIAFPVHTDKRTFDFFREDSCAFYPFTEIKLNFGVFRNTSYVNRVLVEPWVNCALTQNCVCPVFSDTPCPGHLTNHSVGQCHKSDQSVLNILLSKIFRYNVHRVTLGEHESESHVRPLVADDLAPFTAENSTSNETITSDKIEENNSVIIGR